MSFSDIFKKSFLEGFGGDISIYRTITVLTITLIISLYIYLVYRAISRDGFYSRTFNISLATISLVTASIVLAMQSSIVISLGMVGALSIVRFRTAIKDPIDLLFLFWSISTGIICGAGIYMIAIVSSLVITLVLVTLQLIPMCRAPYLLVLNSSSLNLEDLAAPILKKYAPHYKVKSRTLTADSCSLIVELRTKKEKDLIQEMNRLEGITSATLLSHDGDDIV